MGIFGFKWKYRVRDCKERTTAYCETLEQAIRVADMEPAVFLRRLLEQGESVSDGVRYKVDVKGSYYDNTWIIGSARGKV
jgi:hypothetical protein